MTVQANESKHSKKGPLSGLLGGGKTIWAIAIVVALLTCFGALTILGNAAATTTYYVLGRPVAARTQITPDMLMEKKAKRDEAPPTAFDIFYVRDNPVFSQIALNAGDVVTASNAGPLTRISQDLPDNFVAASFPVTPEYAVAGKIRKGDFIDIIASSKDDADGKISKVVLQHVLVLDVTVSPASIAQEATAGQEGQNLDPGPESEAVRSGIPSLYTVGLSPEDATKLALIRSFDLFVVLSANLPDASMDVSTQLGNVFESPANDASAGTFGSVFVKRWDVAFTPGNVYVDDDSTLWKVNTGGQWATTGTTLKAEDLPPGYLPVPDGIDFTDADDVYWIVEDGLWFDAASGRVLEQGDNPTGFDPHAEFTQRLDDAN